MGGAQVHIGEIEGGLDDKILRVFKREWVLGGKVGGTQVHIEETEGGLDD